MHNETSEKNMFCQDLWMFINPHVACILSEKWPPRKTLLDKLSRLGKGAEEKKTYFLWSFAKPAPFSRRLALNQFLGSENLNLLCCILNAVFCI